MAPEKMKGKGRQCVGERDDGEGVLAAVEGNWRRKVLAGGSRCQKKIKPGVAVYERV